MGEALPGEVVCHVGEEEDVGFCGCAKPLGELIQGPRFGLGIGVDGAVAQRAVFNGICNELYCFAVSFAVEAFEDAMGAAAKDVPLGFGDVVGAEGAVGRGSGIHVESFDVGDEVFHSDFEGEAKVIGADFGGLEDVGFGVGIQ